MHPPSLLRPLARVAAVAAALLLAACATRPAVPPPSAEAAPPAPVPVVVAEAWASPAVEADELDSLAAWQAEDGRVWLYATAKGSERVVVFDAATGERVREAGGPGAAPGRFARPNGIAVFGDLLFVVERDNRRVQVLALPGLEPLGAFGQDRLRTPYGLWLYEHAPGELTVLVTDSFMADFKRGVLPPRGQLAERVKRFRVRVDEHGLHADDAGAFGDIGDGALNMVESIAGDPAGNRLLIADEDHRVGSALREYALDGRYLGRSLPVFQGDAEGVALWECEAGVGYWIAAEQVRPTRFHVYARDTLAAAGEFVGARTALTDGVAVFAAPSARFPGGALFALDEDRAVTAFDLREVARALQLSPHCAR
ncbi:phytase [Pseudoxanthomonas broegbernensis]|uniref:Phytase n=1 Tax=Pseudoxanthomonas broegbernensis TaxID=83619 RepID=A0A7V8GKM1_9GAMM|nr:phytase [Pseudoxanthomonas broegbernensis]KAF1685042.1 phytase [Pseudoxanthomonas broegbernensis]MBB6066382.1 3-phytase [Pseudoxanthomonas broegbernensis]